MIFAPPFSFWVFLSFVYSSVPNQIANSLIFQVSYIQGDLSYRNNTRIRIGRWELTIQLTYMSSINVVGISIYIACEWTIVGQKSGDRARNRCPVTQVNRNTNKATCDVCALCRMSTNNNRFKKVLTICTYAERVNCTMANPHVSAEKPLRTALYETKVNSNNSFNFVVHFYTRI